MILIRADANEHIGTGHVMRCLSIADAFVQAGHEVRFVTADHRGDGLIHSRGFDCVCLDSEWTQMEREGVDKVVKEYRPDLLLVDSYYVTKAYTNSLSDIVTLAYLDDLNEKVMSVDFLINYNIFGTVMDYSGYQKSRATLILGPEYAPLRDEFKSVSKHVIKEVTNIMVSAGGADPEGITEKLIRDVCDKWNTISFHFIVGALNPRLETIKEMASEHQNVILHINEGNMSALMQSCDVAISAAGSTLYELCACGTPTITYTLADNQLVAADEFEKQGIMISAGDCRGNVDFINGLAEKLKVLIKDAVNRQQLSTRMQSLVDGYGAERLTTLLWGSIISEAFEAIKDLDAILVFKGGGIWLAIGKTQKNKIMVVEFQRENNKETILHSSFANKEELKIYSGA